MVDWSLVGRPGGRLRERGGGVGWEGGEWGEGGAEELLGDVQDRKEIKRKHEGREEGG